MLEQKNIGIIVDAIGFSNTALNNIGVCKRLNLQMKKENNRPVLVQITGEAVIAFSTEIEI